MLQRNTLRRKIAVDIMLVSATRASELMEELLEALHDAKEDVTNLHSAIQQDNCWSIRELILEVSTKLKELE